MARPSPPSWAKAAPPRSVTREYLRFLTFMPPDIRALEGSWRDPLLRERGVGLVEEMLGDARVRQAVDVVKRAVLTLGYRVEVDQKLAPDEAMQDELKRFVEYSIAALAGSKYESMGDLLQCFEYGYSLNAMRLKTVEYGEWKGRWVVDRFVPLPPGLYKIELDDEGAVLGATAIWGGLSSSAKSGGPATVPLDQIVYMRHQSRMHGPYGKSAVTGVFEPWWNKRMLRRMRNTALDRYGAPFTVAKVPKNTPADKRKVMENIIADMHVEGGAVIDETDSIELISAAGGQGVKTFQDALAYEDREIVGGIAGSNLGMTEGESGSGSYAQARVHQDVFLYTVQALAQNLEETLNEQFVYRLLEWNYGPDLARSAKISWKPATEPDVDAFLAIFAQLAPLEVFKLTDRREMKMIRERLGLWEPFEPATIDPATGQPVDPTSGEPVGEMPNPLEWQGAQLANDNTQLGMDRQRYEVDKMGFDQASGFGNVAEGQPFDPAAQKEALALEQQKLGLGGQQMQSDRQAFEAAEGWERVGNGEPLDPAAQLAQEQAKLGAEKGRMDLDRQAFDQANDYAAMGEGKPPASKPATGTLQLAAGAPSTAARPRPSARPRPDQQAPPQPAQAAPGASQQPWWQEMAGQGDAWWDAPAGRKKRSFADPELETFPTIEMEF